MNTTQTMLTSLRAGVVKADRPTFRLRRRDLIALPIGLAVAAVAIEPALITRLTGWDLGFGLPGVLAAIPSGLLFAALLVGVVLVIERRGLSSMVIRRPRRADVTFAVYAAGIAVAAQGLLSIIVPMERSQGVGELTRWGVPAVLALIVFGAVSEEILYRGYLGERLGALLRSRWAGAVVVTTLFVAPHIVFFGWSWMTGAFLATIATVLTALLRRNLVAAIIVHGGTNLPILIPTVAASL